MKKSLTGSAKAFKISESNSITGNRKKSNQSIDSSDHNENFPVVKLDPKGRILYANSASFELLKYWGCLANHNLPEEFIDSNRQIFELDAQFSLCVKAGANFFEMDVVGFPEGKYIGLYGYSERRS